MKKLKASKCLITIPDGFNCHLGRDLSESFQTAVGKQLRDQNETSRNRMRLEDPYKENNLRIIYTFIKKKKQANNIPGYIRVQMKVIYQIW